MRFIEVTSRSKRKEMMSYNELNAWLNKKARHSVVACHYWGNGKRSMRYVFIDGTNAVPSTLDGKDLGKVVL